MKGGPDTTPACQLVAQAILTQTLRGLTWGCKNFSGSVTWKLRAPVPYRDARRMRNTILSSISRLYRDCIAIGIPDSAVFTTKRGSLGIRIPDSSSVSRLYRDTIAIRNWFCVPGWPVLSLVLRKLSRHSPAEGASAGFFCGAFWSSCLSSHASKLPHQTPQCKILLVLVIPDVEEPDCCAYLSRQKLACVISSSWSLRGLHALPRNTAQSSKNTWYNGNRRHLPTPGLPNPFATFLGGACRW